MTSDQFCPQENSECRVENRLGEGRGTHPGGRRWKERVPTQMNKLLIVLFSKPPPAFIPQLLSDPAAAWMQGPGFLQLPPK